MTPPNIDQETWEKALEATGLWKPKQQCEYTVPSDDGLTTHIAPCGVKIYGGLAWHHGPHEIDAPDATPDVLYKMLEAIARDIEIVYPDCKGCIPCALERHEPELWFDGGNWHCRSDSWAEEFKDRDMGTAIARAAASLEPGKKGDDICRRCNHDRECHTDSRDGHTCVTYMNYDAGTICGCPDFVDRKPAPLGPDRR